MNRDDAALLGLLKAVAIASNEASDLRSAAAVCLDEIRRLTGWPVGHLYLTSSDGEWMEPSGIWSVANSVDYAAFQEVTNHLPLQRGKGLPGRVLATGAPHWIVDTPKDPNFPRAAVAASADLHAGLGFPILAGSVVVGVLEFFAAEALDPDEPLLDLLAQVGRQLGRVSEREQAAERLLASEKRFRSVAQSAADAIVVADGTGNITFWNRAAERMFGYSHDDVIGRPLMVLMPERFRAAHNAGVARVSRGHHSRLAGQTVEFTALHKDGHEFPIEVSLSTWGEHRGRFFSGIIRDITGRRSAEEAAREQEGRLRQAAKMEGIGLLAGGIAHDFNNVVMAIAGCAKILVDDVPESSPFRENVVTIRDSAERASALTRHLLEFSRRQNLRVEPIDLNALVARSLRMLSRLLPSSIEIQTTLGADVPPIRADSTQIEQIILNLLVNARDAMPAGGRVWIETSRVELDQSTREHPGTRAGLHAVITVRDTGIGMDAETRTRIFEPFFTTKGKLGTGLGLSTVHGIVRDSGGKIFVDSQKGQGAAFRIYLPG